MRPALRTPNPVSAPYIPRTLGEGSGLTPKSGPGSVQDLRTSDSVFCSLQPPTPEADYPESLTSYPEEDYCPADSFSEPGPASPLATPPGWSCHVDPDGQTLYTNNFTLEQVGAVCRWEQTASGTGLQPILPQ